MNLEGNIGDGYESHHSELRSRVLGSSCLVCVYLSHFSTRGERWEETWTGCKRNIAAHLLLKPLTSVAIVWFVGSLVL